jgi:protein-S-isoprenylcysteine O-methyltransferase Ste14
MMSPWWYRGRTWVFAAIFFAGFFIGGFVSGALHHAYVPAYRELGRGFANGPRWILAAAAVCTTICFALRVWGSSYLRAGIVWNPDARTDSLLVAGPFRYVRNPLYLGNVFLAIGVGLMAPVAGFALIVIGNVLLVLALAKHEEVMLEARFGERFRAYAARVPSLVPRLSPVAAQGNDNPSLAGGLLSEVFIAALIVGIILIFIDRQHGEIDFFVLYGAGLIAQRLIARAQQQPT